MTESGITVMPITSVQWSDVEQVFGTRGDPARCWCQFFKMPSAQWWESPASEKADLLREQTEHGDQPPGLIAFLDGEPVGWCAVEPRTAYPRVLRSKVVTTASEQPQDDHSVWAITCFVVRVGFRKRGVSRALANAAVDWAREHGARVIEGYPVDVAAKGAVSAAELYHGSISVFEAAGFSVTARPTPGRALMTREL